MQEKGKEYDPKRAADEELILILKTGIAFVAIIVLGGFFYYTSLWKFFANPIFYW